MRAYFQLTLAQLRIYFRNRQAMIWTLVFPFFFMIIFGLLFNDGNNATYSVKLVDLDQSQTSKQVVSILEKQKPLKINEVTQEEKAKNLLKNGKTDFVIVIPNGFQQQIPKNATTQPAKIEVLYNEKNISQVQTGLAVIQATVDGASKAISNYVPKFAIQQKGISGVTLKYLDFLVPGIVAMQIMNSNLNGVAGQIASWRERGVLRRMQGTTLRASTFIAAQITARLILNSLQAMLTILVGYFAFDVSIRGSFLLLILFVVLGTLTFMSIGFIIASLAKSPESAGPIAGFISFPLMFLGGVFFPVSGMPSYLQGFVKTIPITHLSSAMREIMNTGASFSDLSSDFWWLLVWMVVSFIIATKAFRWDVSK
ncbi:ABC transporter permease [Bacillus sp. RG28]|uniref:ABC transporter permease n=1 Tax=Gottfriedia endophytica TaxID=2820819 RepID=A0A940NIL0_9BACI|nr:ABC transporter permease [Gottfriedia endophytica]MBP0724990.1 ABC transporter permease [Gottfriedia endophytica]